MKAKKTLTHSAILAAKPSTKPYKLSDTDRLYILVTKAGKKYWKWNYRLDGIDTSYTFGTFPDISLNNAREARMAAEKLVAKGIHPANHALEQQLKTKEGQASTFWLIAEEWIHDNAIYEHKNSSSTKAIRCNQTAGHRHSCLSGCRET